VFRIQILWQSTTKIQIVDLESKLNELDKESEEYGEIYEEYRRLKESLIHLEQNLITIREELKLLKQQLDNDPINKKYQEAKEETYSFNKGFKEAILEDVIDLNEEQYEELKRAYREAARLCHPDILPDEMKEKAHCIMSELNIARKKKDIKKVKEILLSLRTGGQFRDASDAITDIEVLRTIIVSIRGKISSLKAEIFDIEKSSVFQTIQEIIDKDKYFDGLYLQFEVEQSRLIEELNKLTSSSFNGKTEKTGNTKDHNLKPTANEVGMMPRCPQCDSEMKLRTAKRGKYSGNQFWGCSRYPKCNGLVNI
jgi:hypothetical protein